VIGVLGDDDVGHGGLGRQPTFDQPRGRWRLHHGFLAGPAGVFRTSHHQHPQLRGHDVQPLGDVFADPVQGPAAARAGLVLDVDDGLDPGQVRRQRSAVGSPPGRALGPDGRRCSFRPGLAGGELLFDVFQAQAQLIGVQGLGAAAEAMALQGLDDLAQARVLGVGPVLGGQCGRMLGPLLEEQRLQCLSIARKRLGHRAI
jgi:hypothetical protein